ncbi:hypothetical protein LCGC14_1875320 [marine sediment metagenome]|uniref:Uncharacterized protein n=1 Tax=marine sediment metagenome TaxID=412755 RepID=A0A0F9G3T0_9ZZZZ
MRGDHSGPSAVGGGRTPFVATCRPAAGGVESGADGIGKGFRMEFNDQLEVVVRLLAKVFTGGEGRYDSEKVMEATGISRQQWHPIRTVLEDLGGITHVTKSRGGDFFTLASHLLVIVEGMDQQAAVALSPDVAGALKAKLRTRPVIGRIIGLGEGLGPVVGLIGGIVGIVGGILGLVAFFAS